jgi:glutaredoxin
MLNRPAALTSRTSTFATSAALLLLAACLPAQAQYKVVGPDGRVTYTDRPPTAASGAQISPMRRDGSVPETVAAPLPLELRQAVSRFPVTLYAAKDCAPCDSGRRLLQTRGVPFTERLINDEADAEALVRLSDGRSVPTLTVGKQVLRGYSEADWQSTLDLAAYPRESRLPRGYVPPAPAPLAQRRGEPPPTPAPTPEPPAERSPAPAAPAASGPSIRF